MCDDDNILISVLRNCKYDLKKSEAKLKKFLMVLKVISRKLADIDTKQIESFLDDNIYTIFPYRDLQGRVIVYTRRSKLKFLNTLIIIKQTDK